MLQILFVDTIIKFLQEQWINMDLNSYLSGKHIKHGCQLMDNLSETSCKTEKPAGNQL